MNWDPRSGATIENIRTGATGILRPGLTLTGPTAEETTQELGRPSDHAPSWVPPGKYWTVRLDKPDAEGRVQLCGTDAWLRRWWRPAKGDDDHGRQSA